MNFTFKGIRKEWITATKVRRPYQTNRVLNILRVPSMPGGHLVNVEEEPLVIPVKIEINGNDRDDYFDKAEELASWLSTDEPAPLIFDDRPSRTYYALVEGSLVPEEIVSIGYVEVLFVCPDPYKYGSEVPFQFNGDVGIIENKGTAEAKPIIELEVKKPVPFAMIQNQNNEYMMIGQPIDVENQKPYVKYERIFYDDANTLNGWDTAANGEIDGLIAGSMESVNDRFQAASYGTGTGWHGPAIKKSLPETVRDFRLNTYVALDNSGVAVGRVELYLLDASGNQVTKVAMKDTQSGRAVGFGEARAGNALNNHYLINEYGDREGNWNNFAGILRIERVGNIWYAFFAKGNATDGYHTRRTVYWEDRENKYTAPIAQVVVHMGQYGTLNPCRGGIYSISVEKINPEPSGGVPIIAEPEDIIQFNHEEKMIYINGEPRMDLKDFGGSFFDLQKGENQLVVHPSDAFHTKLRFRERFR